MLGGGNVVSADLLSKWNLPLWADLTKEKQNQTHTTPMRHIRTGVQDVDETLIGWEGNDLGSKTYRSKMNKVELSG